MEQFSPTNKNKRIKITIALRMFYNQLIQWMNWILLISKAYFLSDWHRDIHLDYATSKNMPYHTSTSEIALQSTFKNEEKSNAFFLHMNMCNYVCETTSSFLKNLVSLFWRVEDVILIRDLKSRDLPWPYHTDFT